MANPNNNTPVTGIPLTDLIVTPPASAPDARPLASTVVTQPQPLLPISNEHRRVVEI